MTCKKINDLSSRPA